MHNDSNFLLLNIGLFFKVCYLQKIIPLFDTNSFVQQSVKITIV